jgi:hypothetical protein
MDMESIFGSMEVFTKETFTMARGKGMEFGRN